MPVGPIGNMNFIHQNMAYPATQASNELAKEGFAAHLNMTEFKEKERALEKLEKVVQTQETSDAVEEKKEEEKKKKKEEQNLAQDEAQSEEDEDEKDEAETSAFEKAQGIPHIDISI
ncbi:hypothetical protein [Campylobacter sp.]|uniref:hypothetical protein n=1 Tax=Campylobacter sp. TaxID=205 RepID=UPI0026DCA969|nr:hypothetical protein [Campylobacter sp.]MDO4674763.1 hypothetical protein [Campylobacter sp.]